jgi:hypothetical protein
MSSALGSIRLLSALQYWISDIGYLDIRGYPTTVFLLVQLRCGREVSSSLNQLSSVTLFLK